MTTKRQKKDEEKVVSKQVRVENKWHRKLKVHSAESGVTITRLLSKACEGLFEDMKV